MKPALELDAEDFRKVFEVNVLGVFNTAQAAGAWVLSRFSLSLCFKLIWGFWGCWIGFGLGEKRKDLSLCLSFLFALPPSLFFNLYSPT